MDVRSRHRDDAHRRALTGASAVGLAPGNGWHSTVVVEKASLGDHGRSLSQPHHRRRVITPAQGGLCSLPAFYHCTIFALYPLIAFSGDANVALKAAWTSLTCSAGLTLA